MELKNKFLWISIFSISMGFLESSVVVYLRELYYPLGFDFPLREMSPQILNVELLRELSTLFMLVSLAILAGKTFIQKFSWFIFSFAVWDISYYIFLKLILNWPDSISDWDILFLLPVMWTGPVWAPVVNSLSMIVLAIVLLQSGNPISISKKLWGLLIFGSVAIISSYMYDFFFSEYETISEYIPDWFNWPLYLTGQIIIIISIIIINKSILTKNR